MIKYSNYNSSGIEWFGNIPKDWKVRRLKNVLKIYGRIGYRGYTVEDIVDPGEGCIALSPSNIKNDKLVFEKNTYITWFKYEESPEIQIFKGDVVYVKTGSTIGKVAYVDDVHEPMTLNPQNIVFKEFRINSKYLYYTLQNDSSKIQTKFGIIGGATPALSQEKLGEFKIVVPNSLTEQTLIANYLDEKTSKLDLLISNKKEQIKRLKEIRQIEINTAVTKGLDPNVKLKPSGVEFIGNIPEHWELWKLSSKFKDISSGTTPQSGSDKFYSNGVFPWINTGDLNDSILYSCKKKVTQIALDEHSVLKLNPSGVLIMAMYGATIGKLGITTFEATCNQACCVIGKSKSVDTKYLFYWLMGNRVEVVNRAYGGGQPNISQDVIKRLRITCPPAKEQIDIVKYLDEKTNKIDQLVSNLENQIKQLQEIRKIEIYNAVTGKIKVA
jgi:type I restriction enzyme S subunit